MIMSNNNDYVRNLTDYITDITGIQTEVYPLATKEKDKLPLLVTGVYDLHGGMIMGVPVVFAREKDGNRLTPSQIGKHMDIIKHSTGHHAVYVTEDMLAYNANRLSSHHVNFIVPGKQMFIPSLLIDIKKPVISGTDTVDIYPFTQMLLLFHLEAECLDGLTAKEVSQRFNVSYATANRAVRWLTEKELATTTKGKEKRLSFILHGQALWQKALPHLVSPVMKTIKTNIKPKGGLVCGVNALSEFTMINPSQGGCYAISRDAYDDIGKHSYEEYGENTIEIWKYAPELLAKDGVVDRLSLYLSLKDSEDERIQIELEHLIDNMQWLEV